KRQNRPVRSRRPEPSASTCLPLRCAGPNRLRRKSDMNSKQTKPSIVFAHGLWADGSCFSKLIPTLQAEGHQVVAAQNSLDTLKGDVAAVTRALGRVRSPAILVGHSYGGTVITAA